MDTQRQNTWIGSEWLICTLIFLVTSTVFLNSPVTRVADSMFTLLLSEQIVDHGNLRLDEFFARDAGPPATESARQIMERRGHFYFAFKGDFLTLP